MKRNLPMTKKQKVLKHHKPRKCYSKYKGKHLKILRGCKKCCCILSLFVSHFVVCGCSHSEANLFPCKKYSGENDDTIDSRYNNVMKDSNRYLVNKDVLKLESNIGRSKKSGRVLYWKLKEFFINQEQVISFILYDLNVLLSIIIRL